jgi:Domain of unknown function (DUF4192)
MIAAEGLAAVGCMIAVYRRSDGAATDYEIALVTVALRDLDGHERCLGWMDTSPRGLWTDLVRRAQPGHVAAPASLLAWRTVVSLR